jgi:hypothetical protein
MTTEEDSYILIITAILRKNTHAMKIYILKRNYLKGVEEK